MCINYQILCPDPYLDITIIKIKKNIKKRQQKYKNGKRKIPVDNKPGEKSTQTTTNFLT